MQKFQEERTAESNGTYTFGSAMGTKIPATLPTAIFVHTSQPSRPSAGARVKVMRGQTFRYVYAPSTPKVASVAWKEIVRDWRTDTESRSEESDKAYACNRRVSPSCEV
jgi:hypothetical protein